MATGYFQTKERPVAVSARMPPGLKKGLEAIAAEWTELSGARVSVNDVIVRLLEVGVAGVGAEKKSAKR